MQPQKLNDRWVTLTGITIYTLVHLLEDRKDLLYGHDIRYIISFLISVSSVVSMWLANWWIVRMGRTRYPGLTLSLKRIVITGICSLVVSVGINMFFYALSMRFTPGFNPEMTVALFVNWSINMAMYIWITDGMYEAVYRHHLLRELNRRRNEISTRRMKSELDTLRNRVNPHFLFNSLNTLSALIYADPQKAELFVEELSGVYRYLLRNNGEEMTTLRTEMKFIESYLMLLKIRFGEGLVTALMIEEKFHNLLLPPLSLQLLTENAVKHNIVSRQMPLRLAIRTESGKLVVENNLQRKKQTVPSEKTGLNYIVSRYAILGHAGVEIAEDEQYFTVRLPLLAPLPEEVKSTNVQAQ